LLHHQQQILVLKEEQDHPTLWTQSAAKALANGTIESETAIKQYFRKLVFMSSPFERV
jgi:hypothetical protein